MLAAGLLLVPALVASVPVEARGYADVWDHFAILVWQYRTPPAGPDAAEAYAQLNLRGIHLDNGFSDELLEFAQEHSYEYYVDHAAGKGDLHLYPRDWEAFRADYRENRDRPTRPICLHDPDMRDRLVSTLRQNVPRAAAGNCLAYSFDDEISTTSFTSPADVCWAPATMAAFREWLRVRYRTVGALNARWGSDFTEFAEAVPAQVDELRHYHERPFSEWNLAPWADHREFMDDAFAELLTELRYECNRLDAGRPAGFVGGQAPSPYGGYDYAKLTRAVQWMEAYDIGASNEILRSLWAGQSPQVQTYFATGSPHVDKWFLWYYLVHGNRGVIVWPEMRGSPWFDGAEPQPALGALSDTFLEVQGGISRELLAADFSADGIALYYSQPSIRVSWFMDIEPHGASWVNRSSSLNNANASDLLNRVAWTKWLEDVGVQYDFLSYLDVREGIADLSRFRVIVLPRTFALSDVEAAALRDFVQAGGTLIADYGAGTFDEFGAGRSSGALDDMFGIRRDVRLGVLDGSAIAEINAELYNEPAPNRAQYAGAFRHGDFVQYERGVTARASDAMREPSPGPAFHVTNDHGGGRTEYLNVTPTPYLWSRRAPEGFAYRRLLEGVLAQAGITPRARVLRDGVEAHTVERLFWQAGDATYLCLVENPIRDAKIDGMGTSDGVPERDREDIEVHLTSPAGRVTDARTAADLGSGSVLHITWNPHEAAVLRL
ncbi:hypothetical protein HN937_13245, partial [Candidatus Poribacteria bacterium]|nr:hypothetical protein [Candidatus Poribacteria bacterium]